MPAPDARERPTIQVRRRWTDPWRTEDELRVDGPVELNLGSARATTVRLLRKYGPRVKYPSKSSYKVDATPYAYLDYWLRLLKPGTQTVLWQGLIKDDQREVYRSGGNQRGVQTLVAWGPEEIARRCTVSTAYWMGADGETVQELGWVPPVNCRGVNGELEGNRGPKVLGKWYVYSHAPGGLWSHYDYLRYIVTWHLQQRAATGGLVGPTWTVAGQTELLGLWITQMRFAAQQSALSIIRRLVPPPLGADFAILPTSTGFEIRVFALSKNGGTFGDAIAPSNPDKFTVNPTTEDHVVACRAERSSRERVDRLEVAGERIRSCFTIDWNWRRQLWTSAQETAYKAGTGVAGDDADKHDEARADDRLSLVYQAYAALATWDWDQGRAAPILDAKGEVAGTGAARQNEHRETLREIPLKRGGDYSTSTPDLSGASEERVPPLAVIDLTMAGTQYGLVDKLNAIKLTEKTLADWLADMSVRALAREWGVLVEASPNHALARNHWTGANPTDRDPDDSAGYGLDYAGLEFTIAAKTDQRLRCLKLETRPENDGSKRVVEVPGARLEYLNGGTLIGVNPNCTRRYSPSAGVVLRNDNEILHAVMAAAIERYLENRFRVVITWKGLHAFASRVGKILVMGLNEGDLQTEWALVTSVSWDFDEGTTTVRAGYAR